MLIGTPDRPTPIGCFVAFLALFPANLSAFLFWVAHKMFTHEPPKVDLAKELLISGAVVAIPALVGFGFFIYRACNIGQQQTWNFGSSLKD